MKPFSTKIVFEKFILAFLNSIFKLFGVTLFYLALSSFHEDLNWVIMFTIAKFFY
jgi:hypothetical protein